MVSEQIGYQIGISVTNKMLNCRSREARREIWVVSIDIRRLWLRAYESSFDGSMTKSESLTLGTKCKSEIQGARFASPDRMKSDTHMYMLHVLCGLCRLSWLRSLA